MNKDCPHCAKPLPRPPRRWWNMPPWQCSHCHGLYGYGEKGPFPIGDGLQPLKPAFSWLEARRFGFYSQGRSYVYALTYPVSHIPFYIGVGKKQRVCQHYENAWDTPRPTEKDRIIIDLANRGESEWYHFFGIYSDPVKARCREQQLIDRFGLRPHGILANRAKDRVIEREEIEPVEIPLPEGINERTGQRLIHHPDLFKAPGENEPFNCTVCGSACLVPKELMTKRVQCPHCAHLWRPL